MTVRLAGHLRRFRAGERGVAAVEFGLLAPLLVLTLLVAAELGKAYQSYREFEAGVLGIAREVAGFPEYDSRARSFAPHFAAALLPTDWNGNFNMQVTSFYKDAGAMKQEFTHTLFGSNPGLSSSGLIRVADYDQSEYVIFFSATYVYKPMFKIYTGTGFTMTKTYVLNPYFARKYVYTGGQTPDKYVY